MARNLFNYNYLATAADALALSRKSYSSAVAAAPRVVTRGAAAMIGKEEEKKMVKEISDASTSWVPDPVTGCYRPGNRVGEADEAELRRVLLKRQH